MIGAIIGDIAGSRFEFNPSGNYNFELFSPQCDFTDDTICTIAVADAILRGADYGESIHEWCRKYPSPMGGYGGSFRRWVHSDNPEPYGSFGNGAAMRVSPVAYAFTDKEEMLAQSAATALCTHSHPEGIKGAQTVALAIFRAVEMRRKGETPDAKRIIDECVDFSGYDIRLRDENVRGRFDETCQGTVPVALWIISESRDAEDAIRRAVSLEADADTLGAIVGSIAEPIWGFEDSVRQGAEKFLPQEMLQVLKDFEARYPL